MSMSNKKIYLVSIIGEILEWYDFSLYGFLGPVFATLFFPQQDSIMGIMGVFAIFAIGFLSRPLGGLMFGWLADRAGRKSAFFISLLAMATATLLLGCLPTYQNVGFLAPLALLSLRLIQGFSCGGEFSVSMIFLSEHATRKNYYFAGSLTWMGLMIGALLASLVIMVISLNHDFLMQFGWRIPFFIGAAIAVVGIYLRLKVAETPVYLELKKRNKIQQDPWYFIKKHKRIMVKIFVLNAPLAALSYVGVAFLPTFFTKFVGLPFKTAFLLNTILIISLIVLIPLSGYIADKWRGERVYKWAIIFLILMSVPAYYCFAYQQTWIGYAAAILCTAIPGAMIKSVVPGLSVQLAPLEDRAVVMSVAYNVAYSLIGGTAPLFMSYLLDQTHLLVFPALYVIFFAVIAWSALRKGVLLNLRK